MHAERCLEWESNKSKIYLARSRGAARHSSLHNTMSTLTSCTSPTDREEELKHDNSSGGGGLKHRPRGRRPRNAQLTNKTGRKKPAGRERNQSIDLIMKQLSINQRNPTVLTYSRLWAAAASRVHAVAYRALREPAFQIYRQAHRCSRPSHPPPPPAH